MSNRFVAFVVDTLERAGFTFVQVLVPILLSTGSAGLGHRQFWFVALSVGGFSALMSVGTSILTWNVTLTPGWDLVLRVVKTFVQAFTGVFVASGATDLVHADWSAALAVAVPAALAALVKGLAAMNAHGTHAGATVVPLRLPAPPSVVPAAAA